MWLNEKPAIHISDTKNGFQNAFFIKEKSAESLWIDFIYCLAYVYIWFPEIIWIDREKSFMSMKFLKNADNVGIELQFSGIEAHNSIGQGERFYHPLRSIGRNGLKPLLLVFVTLLSFPAPSTTNWNQMERFNALTLARAKMKTIVAQRRIRTAFRSILLPATMYLIRPGDDVHICR